MADNNSDFTKKILIDVELKGEQAKLDVPTLAKEIQRLTDANKVLEIQQQKNSKKYVENASNIRLLKQELRDTNKFIDNTSKAFKDVAVSSDFASNSIKTNRALLSLMTAEHIKLGVANGNTKKQIDQSAESVRNLTEVLKAQEKQIGQTYRNVGNYSEALREIAQELGSSIPGFQQFNTAINVATKVAGFLPTAITNMGAAISKTGQQFSSFVGFKQFTTDSKKAEQSTNDLAGSAVSLGETTTAAAEGLNTMGAAEGATATAAEGATGAVTGLGVAVTAIMAVFAAAAVVVVGFVQYLKTIDSVGDTIEQRWAGIKAAFYAAGTSIEAGDWKMLAANMFLAQATAESLTASMQDLADAMVAQEVHNAAAEEQINTLMLKMRNKRVTAAEEQQYFDEIQSVATKNYNDRKKNADALYDLTIKEIANNSRLSQDKIDRLKKEGVDYAIVLENSTDVNERIVSGSYKKIAEAQKQQIAVQQAYDSIKERSQNRLDAKEMAAEAARAQAEQKAEALRQKKSDAYNEAQNIRKNAASMELQNIYEEYGDRAVQAQTAYDNELLKLKKFLDKKLITREVYNSVEAQLTETHQNDIAKIIDDFRKSDEAKLKDAYDKVRDLQIVNIADDEQRAISSLKHKSSQERAQLDLDSATRVENIKALDIEIKALDGDAKAEAEERRLTELSLIDANQQKKAAIIKRTEREISDVTRRAARDRQAAEDDANVLKSKKGTNIFSNGGAQSAELQAITNRYDFEIAEAERAGKTTVLLEQQKIDALKAINDQYRNERIEYAAQAEQMVQSAVVDIISQSQQQQSAAKLAQIDAARTAELDNASLTNTQKRLIEQKYKKQEEAEKLRAFKANQKLQAANIVINGAVAVSKTIAEMGFLPSIPFVALTIASTALQLGKVLSAKPGFAKGGVYESDGKGAMLPGYSRTDNVNSKLRSGEAVVVSEAMRVPWARNTVSKINEMFGGRSFATAGGSVFATGGIFTDGGNANRYYAQPVYDQAGLANSLAYQLINNMPNIIVDVKDVNAQQGILARTEDRVVL